MDDELQNSFVVFIRDGSEPADRPDAAEQVGAACPTYDEAARAREKLRHLGVSCVIRCVGETGGGD